MAEPATDEQVEKLRVFSDDPQDVSDLEIAVGLCPAVLARLDAEIAARRAAEARVAELAEAIKSGRIWSVIRQHMSSMRARMEMSTGNYEEDSILFDSIARDLEKGIQKELMCRMEYPPCRPNT